MSVQQIIDGDNRLQATLDRFDTERAAIEADTRISVSYRDQQLAELKTSAAAAATQTATVLFGAVEQGTWEQGSFRLSDRGIVQQTLAQLNERTKAATQAAERVSDPAQMELAIMRVKSVIANAGRSTTPGKTLAQAYDNGSELMRIAFQDNEGVLFSDGDADTAMLRGRIQRDRAARVNTPERQAALAETDRAVAASDRGYRLVVRATRTFWPEFTPDRTNYLHRVADNVVINRENMIINGQPMTRLDISFKYWGVRYRGSPVFAGNGQESQA